MFDEARERMVEEQLIARGIRDARLLDAFHRTPRHLFVPQEYGDLAYADRAVPAGSQQTISQPYIVALMIEALRLQGHERVLEIGTGSGYEAALLAQLALELYSVERLPELASAASRRLASLELHNVQIAVRDGTLGWPERAPFDGILVAAAAPQVPPPLLEQLAEGGRLILPLGARRSQILTLMERQGEQLRSRSLAECVFVPLVGAFGWTE